MIDRMLSALRDSLARIGFAGSAAVLAAMFLLAVSPSPSEAAVTNSHTGASCAQAGPFPYGSTAVGIAPTADDGGYWIVTDDGHVAACGGAPYLGEQTTLNAPIIGIAATPDGGGYYLVASDGGVFAFGDAHFQGSTGSIHLNKPVVGMAVDPVTGGYWLVASDGGVFAYNSPFFGSAGSIVLNEPVVGMAFVAKSGGYLLVAGDGGVFAYNAEFFGSPATYNGPSYVGMMTDPTGQGGGYMLVASDGSTAGASIAPLSPEHGWNLNAPIVGVEVNASYTGCRYVAADGGVFAWGASGFYGTPVFGPAPS